MHRAAYYARIVGVFLVSAILIFPEVAKAQKLIAGWSAVSALNAPYWVIKDAGFAKQEGYTFRVLIDELDENEAFKVSDPYGVAGTPTLFVVDRAGKVTFGKAGRVKDEEIEKAITAVVEKK